MDWPSPLNGNFENQFGVSGYAQEGIHGEKKILRLFRMHRIT